MNGGACVDDVNAFNCVCRDGYSGLLCQTLDPTCVSSPCLNGGTCVGGADVYSCTCVTGYSGINCESDINECSSAPCQNSGTCVDTLNGYHCLCVAPFGSSGCVLNCLNGAGCSASEQEAADKTKADAPLFTSTNIIIFACVAGGGILLVVLIIWFLVRRNRGDKEIVVLESVVANRPTRETVVELHPSFVPPVVITNPSSPSASGMGTPKQSPRPKKTKKVD